MIVVFVNGGRSISNYVIKTNGGRNANEIIIEYIRDLFTVNDNFIISCKIILPPFLLVLFVMNGETVLQNFLSWLEQFFLK